MPQLARRRDLGRAAPDEHLAQVLGVALGPSKDLHRARGELIDVLRTNTYAWELSA